MSPLHAEEKHMASYAGQDAEQASRLDMRMPRSIPEHLGNPEVGAHLLPLLQLPGQLSHPGGLQRH